MNDLILVYPVQWPLSRPRTIDRAPARFREGTGGSATLSFDAALGRLRDQLKRLRAQHPSLSTDVRHNRDGSRDRTSKGSETPADPAAVVWFRLDGRDYELACDRWDTVAGNVAAVAAHIDALRGQERWGVADLKQAFAGHLSLPAPDPWWSVLDLSHRADRADVERAYRSKARSAHPDVGGDRAAWDRLQAAYAAGKEATA